MDDLDSILADLSAEAGSSASTTTGGETTTSATTSSSTSGADGGGNTDLDNLLTDLGVGPEETSRKAKRSSVIMTDDGGAAGSSGGGAPAGISAETTAVLNAIDSEDRSGGNAVCAGCQLPIFANVLQAMGKDWHAEHFTCVLCSTQLKTDKFLIRDDRPYCPNCHDSLLDKCAKCSMPITDAPIKALDQSWHTACFTCSCGLVFAEGDGSFIEQNGTAYCDECFATEFGQRCDQCGGAIAESAIDAGGKSYCKDCFKCSVCNASITTTGSINFFEVDGSLYCSEHVPSGAVSSTVCAACDLPIIGDAAIAEDQSYHSSCLTCDQCSCELAGTRFFLRDSTRVCAACAGQE